METVDWNRFEDLNDSFANDIWNNLCGTFYDAVDKDIKLSGEIQYYKPTGNEAIIYLVQCLDNIKPKVGLKIFRELNPEINLNELKYVLEEDEYNKEIAWTMLDFIRENFGAPN